MAWYSDEEYEYRQDVREKSITARSARYKRTHCGKGGAVKFPSDYLTAKERKAMNGEVKTYNISKPMNWEEFKELPNDLKIGYIKMLRHRFDIPDTHIAEAMGTTRRNLGIVLADLKLNLGKGSGHGKWPRELFEAWWAGEEAPKTPEEPVVNAELPVLPPDIDIKDLIVEAPVEPVVDVEPENAPVEVVEDKIDILVPESGQMTFRAPANRIMDMIKVMLGNKNVELTVSWSVIKEE